MNYIVMICDVKNSRRLQNREALQYELISMLKEANMIFRKCILAPFIITLGDEWEGLLKGDADYSQILDFFRERISNIEFYCGIGIGDVSINNFELTVNQLDGPAFHKARKALKVAKQRQNFVVFLD